MTANFPELVPLLQRQFGELVAAVAWSPTRSTWAACAADGAVMWTAESGVSHWLRTADGKSIDKIAFSHDGLWLAAGGQSGQLSIWNCDVRQQIDTPPQLSKILTFDRWIEQLDWHPTSARLAIGSAATVSVWDPIAEREIGNWRSGSSVLDLGWHPSGASLAIAGAKGVRVWSPETHPLQSDCLTVDTATIKLAWSEDGRYLAAGNLDRTLTICDWQHPDDPWILQGCQGKIRYLDWLTGLNLLCLAVAAGSELLLWDLSSDRTEWSGRCLSGHQNTISALTTHPHLPMPLSSDRDGYACLWSETGEIAQILADTASEITCSEWNETGTQLAIGHLNGELEIWMLSA